MTDLVRVKDKFQVTIPIGARRANPIREGDYLEVTPTDDGGFLLRPRQGAIAPKRPRSMLDFLRQNHTVIRSRQEIDAELNSGRDSWRP